ncbi:MAG: transcriptional repressor [Bacteroidaceae bacterium]|nr:transcriptional repressor [Bacteroidaceae bacterium]
MMIKRNELKNELIAAGIRPSVQRVAIFEYVRKSKAHPTAEVVHAALRDELGSLSLTTVYNTLKLFVDAGLILMLNIDDTFRCFDGNIATHAHLKCEECGKIYDFQIDADCLRAIKGIENYKITDMQIYLKGICPACKNN